MTAPVEMTYKCEGPPIGRERLMAFLYGDKSTGSPGRKGNVEVVDVPAASRPQLFAGYVGWLQFYRPDLLALSASLHTQLVTLKETVWAVCRRQHGSTVKILVGGRALAEATDLAQSIGADGYAADPNAAVRMANKLVGLLVSAHGRQPPCL